MYEATGYYLNCDDAVCIEHAPEGFADGDYSKWAGFRGWETPAVILDSEESDSPTHCSVEKCEALIPHELTSAGYEYVAEHVTSFLLSEGGRREILLAWWDQYGDVLSDETLQRIADDGGLDRPDVTAGEIREAIEYA